MCVLALSMELPGTIHSACVMRVEHGAEDVDLPEVWQMLAWNRLLYS